MFSWSSCYPPGGKFVPRPYRGGRHVDGAVSDRAGSRALATHRRRAVAVETRRARVSAATEGGDERPTASTTNEERRRVNSTMDSLDAVLPRTTTGSEAESRAVDAPPPRPMGGTREERAARELAERDAAVSEARAESSAKARDPGGGDGRLVEPAVEPAVAGVQRADGRTVGGVRAGVVPRRGVHRRPALVQARGRQRQRRLPRTRPLRRRRGVRPSRASSVFTAGLVDFGLVHFALVNAGLALVGAEAEALLGTFPFLAVYALSAAFGGVASVAMDPSKLHVRRRPTGSHGRVGRALTVQRVERRKRVESLRFHDEAAQVRGARGGFAVRGVGADGRRRGARGPARRGIWSVSRRRRAGVPRVVADVYERKV